MVVLVGFLDKRIDAFAGRPLVRLYSQKRAWGTDNHLSIHSPAQIPCGFRSHEILHASQSKYGPSGLGQKNDAKSRHFESNRKTLKIVLM